VVRERVQPLHGSPGNVESTQPSVVQLCRHDADLKWCAGGAAWFGTREGTKHNVSRSNAFGLMCEPPALWLSSRWSVRRTKHEQTVKEGVGEVNALTEAEQQAPAVEIRYLTLTFPDKPGAAEASAAEAKPELGEAAPTAPATPAPLPAQPTSASMEP